jgi:hypothetical protein
MKAIKKMTIIASISVKPSDLRTKYSPLFVIFSQTHARKMQKDSRLTRFPGNPAVSLLVYG